MSALTAPPLEHGAATGFPSCTRSPSPCPPELEAPAPPEYRGMTRDAVRMLVATKSDGTLVHSTSPSSPASSTRATSW